MIALFRAEKERHSSRPDMIDLICSSSDSQSASVFGCVNNDVLVVRAAKPVTVASLFREESTSPCDFYM